jgi:hypothetical protein
MPIDPLDGPQPEPADTEAQPESAPRPWEKLAEEALGADAVRKDPSRAKATRKWLSPKPPEVRPKLPGTATSRFRAIVSALLSGGSARESIVDTGEAAAEELPGEVLESSPARAPTEQDVLDALAPDDAPQDEPAAAPAAARTQVMSPAGAPTATLKMRARTGTLVMRGHIRKPGQPRDAVARLILGIAAFIVIAAIGLSAWLAVRSAASGVESPAAPPTTNTPPARPPR